MVIPIPNGFSMVEAASLPEVRATTYLNLQQEAGGIRLGGGSEGAAHPLPGFRTFAGELFENKELEERVGFLRRNAEPPVQESGPSGAGIAVDDQRGADD